MVRPIAKEAKHDGVKPDHAAAILPWRSEPSDPPVSRRLCGGWRRHEVSRSLVAV
jgi:hypothetical protein